MQYKYKGDFSNLFKSFGYKENNSMFKVKNKTNVDCQE